MSCKASAKHSSVYSKERYVTLFLCSIALKQFHLVLDLFGNSLPGELPKAGIARALRSYSLGKPNRWMP